MKKPETPSSSLMTEAQKQILSFIAPIAIVASIIGTFYVSQYRMGQMEKRLDSQGDDMKDLATNSQRMSEDIVAIKTTLGIRAQTQKPTPVTVLGESTAPTPTPAPRIEIKVENNSREQDGSADVAPTPAPTPLPVPTPLINIPPILKLPNVLP